MCGYSMNINLGVVNFWLHIDPVLEKLPVGLLLQLEEVGLEVHWSALRPLLVVHVRRLGSK